MNDIVISVGLKRFLKHFRIQNIMQLTFLGTSSMVPTKERNQTAVFLSYGSEGILFDCGEGTQRQFKITGISLTKVTKILISHWHGDHVLGLPGLMQTLSSTDYNGTLEIYGPIGTKKRIESMFQAFVFDKRLDFKVKEAKQGMFFDGKDFQLEAYPLEHGIETLGYRLVEKDRRKVDMKKARKLGIPEGPLIGKLQQGESIEHNNKKIKEKEFIFSFFFCRLCSSLPWRHCLSCQQSIGSLLFS